ncbi:MAG: hypothetical protein ACOH2H_21065 [Cypionkella sp.]
MTTIFSRQSFLFAAPAVVALSGPATAGFFIGSVSDDLDASRTKLSDGGLYRAELMPEAAPITVGTMHDWTVLIRTASGEPVTKAEIKISGAMRNTAMGCRRRRKSPRTLALSVI